MYPKKPILTLSSSEATVERPVTPWSRIKNSLYLVTVSLFVIGVLPGNTYAQFADQYRKAAAAHREAASKCPPRSACYNANAAYYDCLANKLGGSNVQCVEPTCSLTEPACGGATSTSSTGGVSGSNSTAAGIIAANDAQAQVISDSVIASINLIGEVMAQNRRDKQRKKDMTAENRAFKENALNMDAKLNEQLNKEMADQIEAELTRQEAASKGDKPAKTPVNQNVSAITAPGHHLIAGLTPAFPESAYDTGSWSPWFAMETPDGLIVQDLDIAYWSGGGTLPSGSPRDFPTTWVIRNRSQAPIKVQYELEISCATQCTSGWYRFITSVPANKTSSSLPTRYTLMVGANRVLNIEVANDGPQ